jgi:hypothetical protein
MFPFFSEFFFLFCATYLFNAMAGHSQHQHELGKIPRWTKAESAIAGIPALGALIWPIFYGRWWLGIIAWIASGLFAFLVRKSIGSEFSVLCGLPLLAFGLYHLSMPWWR